MDLQALFKEIHPNGSYQGWYKVFGDEQSKVANDTVYTPNGTEETLYGKFGYVITFINDGKVQETLFTTVGSKGNQLATEPKAPTNPGKYTNRGWWTNENGTGTQYVKGMEFSGNTTFYVKRVSVITYNNNGLGSKPVNKEIVKGQQITAAGLPTLTGNPYTFRGWCATNPANVGAAVLQASWVPTGNTTIYAKWVSVIQFQGKKDEDGRYDTVEVLKGQSVNSGSAGHYYSIFGFLSYYVRDLTNGVGPQNIEHDTDFIPVGNATYGRKLPY